MIKTIRTVKLSVVMGILLFSLFAVFMPSSAGAGMPALFNAKPDIAFSYDPAAIEEEFKPVGGTYTIPVDIRCAITGLFAKQVENILKGKTKLSIELSSEPTQDWFSCVVSNSMVHTEIATGYQSTEENVNIAVTLDERAPAKTMGKLIVTMHVIEQRAPFARVEAKTFTAPVIFTPAFLPIVSVSPKKNFEEITPGQTADIPVELENLGNAKTVVDMEIVDVPKDWAANIPTRVTLGSGVLGEDAVSTVTLTVQPPYGFGYHNDRESIKVKFTPSYYGEPGSTEPSVSGNPQTETFIIQSRGFSTPGFGGAEVILALFAFIAIVFFIRRNKR